jgi:glucosamine--fructose-6-phosphate aminotransferase (isomerizing)
MSMVNPKAVVIGLVSDRNYSYEMAVLEEMKKLGARVVSLGEENVEVPFHSNLPEPVRAVLYLPLLQLMAYYRSLAKNCNPDHPQNLSAVVELDI